MGYLLLEGGAEFGGQMAAPDQKALALAGGLHAQLSIIPAAAAPDNNHVRAGENGRRWFENLGATHVGVLPLIDRATAQDPMIARELARSRMIYLLGGFPGYLADILTGSVCWQAMLDALSFGGVLAGSSAGAMVLCDHYYDPGGKQVEKGMGVLSNACVLPHHDTHGKQWVSLLQNTIPAATLIGIDEETGTINDGPDNTWRVYGKGRATLYRGNQVQVYAAGEVFII